MNDIVINDGEEVLSRLWNNILSRGVVNRRLDSSRLGLLLSAIASEFNVTLSLIQTYMDQFILSSCTDQVMMENMARMFAVRRLSSKSKVILEFYKLDSNLETIKIPAGFKVGSTTDSKIAFRTVSDAFLWKGSQSTTVMAYSITSGKKNNIEAGILNRFEDNGYNTKIAVINNEPAFGGYDDESIQDLRNKATGFRYNRDNSKYNVKQILYDNGIPEYRYFLEEYHDGPGTFLVCLDTTSDAEFENIQTVFNYRHFYGVKPVFKRATREYVNMYIAITTTGEEDYTPLEKQDIYTQVSERIQRFFAAYCVVGADLNVGRLKASILSELSEYEIKDISITFDPGVVVTKEDTIKVPKTYKLFPNKIITDINYTGETNWTNDEDMLDDEEYVLLFEE